MKASIRFPNIVWLEHCFVGEDGHNIYPQAMDAIVRWSNATGKSVRWLYKGQNQLTEFFSVMRAQVVVNDARPYNHEPYKSHFLLE